MDGMDKKTYFYSESSLNGCENLFLLKLLGLAWWCWFRTWSVLLSRS